MTQPALGGARRVASSAARTALKVPSLLEVLASTSSLLQVVGGLNLGQITFGLQVGT